MLYFGLFRDLSGEDDHVPQGGGAFGHEIQADGQRKQNAVTLESNRGAEDGI